MPKIYFDRTHPKGELWEQLEELFHEDCFSYGLNLEWSLNIPIAYVSTGAYSRIEVMKESGDDPVLMRLPKQHVYLVESETARHPVELIFTENG